MAKEYSILFQKPESPVKDLLTDFSMVCLDFPFRPWGETKDLVSDDWAGEDGEDTFFPEKLPMKAYDLKVEIGYKGDLGSAYQSVTSLMNYLTTDGTELKIYNPYTGIGRRGVYLKEFENEVFVKGDVTFRYTLKGCPVSGLP